MTKEFEDYFEHNRRRLLAKAPKELQDELLESTSFNTPIEWACIIVPLGVGIFMQPFLPFRSELLNWGVVCVVVVILFVVMQMIRPYFTKKKNALQAIEDIKKYYYERYEQTGDLAKIEPW